MALSHIVRTETLNHEIRFNNSLCRAVLREDRGAPRHTRPSSLNKARRTSETGPTSGKGYPSKVTTGGQAPTLQENTTRGYYVGCGRQRPPRPSTSSWLSSCCSSYWPRLQLYWPGSLDKPRHLLGISSTQLGLTSNFSAYCHRRQDGGSRVSRDARATCAHNRSSCRVGVTIGIMLIVSCCCCLCCGSLLALA